MHLVLWSIITWIFREIVLKFILMGLLFIVISEFVPWVIGFILPFIGTGNLSAAFSNIPPGVWFFLDFFQLGYGVPLMISAYIARFLIRRIPVIG